MFLTFLSPPTHLFDDLILEWSLTQIVHQISSTGEFDSLLKSRELFLPSTQVCILNILYQTQNSTKIELFAMHLCGHSLEA